MSTTVIDPKVARLRDRVRGQIVAPGDRRYDATRAVWNGAIDRRPAVIVQPRDEQDIAAAIAHARETGMEIAVRGGGHSMAGHSMSEGGMTIDLSALNRVTVDPAARTARIGGGALLADVMRASQPHDLAMPFGHVSHTGVGGLILGGGLGWIMRRDGMTVDRLRSMRMVTVDGDTVRAAPDEHPDLFWALRGGGGNFGVVTEFEIELRPFGPAVLAGMILHPLDRAPGALRFSRDFMEQAPRALTVFETFMVAPHEPPFPPELQGRPALALGVVYAGDPEEGARVLRPLREHGRPALDLVGPMPPLAVQEMLDPTAPHGMRSYSRAHWLAGLPDAAIDELATRHADVPSPMSMIITARMGGAIEDVSADATAYGHRDANRLLWVIGAGWESEDEPQVAWARGVFDAMTPHSTGGVYVNALEDEGPERARAAYGDATWRRLVEAKDRWDPDNVLHLNQNVPPSG